MHDCTPNESALMLKLMGDGQSKQHGGDAHVVVTLVEMYIPGGHRTVRDWADAGDSRPSGNTTRIRHTEYGGPSRPEDNGWHCSCMIDSEMDTKYAGSEKVEKLVVSDRKMHDALVTLDTVNNGTKNLDAGAMG